MPRILFVTSLNLACNPRLYKEIVIALREGYQVKVVAFEMNNWSLPYEQQLKGQLPDVTITYLSSGKKPFLLWMKSSLMKIACSCLRFFRFTSGAVQSFAFDRRSWLLNNHLSNRSEAFDLVVAHNPSAFFPVFAYSKRMGIPYALDIEDYHPGEYTYQGTAAPVKAIMKLTLPPAVYISYASPLIRNYTEQLCNINRSKEVVLLNSFPSAHFQWTSPRIDEKLHLVWFSQHINYQRGLEDFLPLLDSFSEEITLTLIGQLHADFYQQYIVPRTYIKTVHPLNPEVLNRMICEYDVGLAVEDTAAGLNRDICLTNKIIAYRQAGLFIIATSTRAQVQYINSYPGSGVIVNTHTFQGILRELIRTKEEIRRAKAERFRSAQEISWENESIKLKEIWNTVIT